MKIRVKIKSYQDGQLKERYQYADDARQVAKDLSGIISGFIEPEEKKTKLEIDLKKLQEKSPEEKAEFLKKQRNES